MIGGAADARKETTTGISAFDRAIILAEVALITKGVSTTPFKKIKRFYDTGNVKVFLVNPKKKYCAQYGCWKILKYYRPPSVCTNRSDLSAPYQILISVKYSVANSQ